jgi:hypothetical protein
VLVLFYVFNRTHSCTQSHAYAHTHTHTHTCMQLDSAVQDFLLKTSGGTLAAAHSPPSNLHPILPSHTLPLSSQRPVTCSAHPLGGASYSATSTTLPATTHAASLPTASYPSHHLPYSAMQQQPHASVYVQPPHAHMQLPPYPHGAPSMVPVAHPPHNPLPVPGSLDADTEAMGGHIAAVSGMAGACAGTQFLVMSQAIWVWFALEWRPYCCCLWNDRCVRRNTIPCDEAL